VGWLEREVDGSVVGVLDDEDDELLRGRDRAYLYSSRSSTATSLAYHIELLNTDLQSSCMTLCSPGKQCTSTHMATSRGYAPSDLAARRVGDALQAIESTFEVL
jgi:hypothetical protein